MKFTKLLALILSLVFLTTFFGCNPFPSKSILTSKFWGANNFYYLKFNDNGELEKIQLYDDGVIDYYSWTINDNELFVDCGEGMNKYHLKYKTVSDSDLENGINSLSENEWYVSNRFLVYRGTVLEPVSSEEEKKVRRHLESHNDSDDNDNDNEFDEYDDEDDEDDVDDVILEPKDDFVVNYDIVGTWENISSNNKTTYTFSEDGIFTSKSKNDNVSIETNGVYTVENNEIIIYYMENNEEKETKFNYSIKNENTVLFSDIEFTKV